MSAKKILHILSKYEGDYPLVDDFILSLDPRRYESTVCFVRGRSEIKSRLERNGVKVVYLDRVSSKKRGVSLAKLYKLKEIVQREGIRLIHCQRHKPTVYGVLASMLAGGTPVVTTIHGAGRTRSIRRKLANRLLFSKVSRIITVSNTVKRDVLKTNPWLEESKVTTVQNGIEYTKILKADEVSREQARAQVLKGYEDKYWFGVVGRLTPVKNHKALIRAFASVVERQPNSLLVIAGDGLLENEYRTMIQNLGLAEKIHLLGYREDVPVFLRAIDCFVFPSISEGLGLALLEAMASGIPVIVSDIDASREVIDGCECGFYVDPMDEKDIGDTMLKILQIDLRTHELMGESGRKRVIEFFSIDRMIKQIVMIYDSLLDPSIRS